MLIVMGFQRSPWSAIPKSLYRQCPSLDLNFPLSRLGKSFQTLPLAPRYKPIVPGIPTPTVHCLDEWWCLTIRRCDCSCRQPAGARVPVAALRDLQVPWSVVPSMLHLKIDLVHSSLVVESVQTAPQATCVLTKTKIPVLERPAAVPTRRRCYLIGLVADMSLATH